MAILFSKDRFRFCGRIDFTDPERPLLVWPGAYVSFAFFGSELSLELENQRHWNLRSVGFVVDGKDVLIPIDEGVQSVKLCSGLENRKHECVIYKPMSGGYLKLLGLTLPTDSYICEPLEFPAKRIAFYGDSVTAGEVVDADDHEGMTDPDGNNGQWDNSWHSYSMRTGRLLPAQVCNTAQGGIALLDGTGYFEMPNMRGMESCYDKLKYCACDEITEWDFSEFIPHVIVFAIGQNDENPNFGKIHDPAYRRMWKDKYIQLINNIRSHSPKAAVVLALTVLNHDSSWDEALDEIAGEMGGEQTRVYHFMYTRAGRATPGHPRNREQQEMAEELTEFLRGLPQDVWKD